MNVPSPYCQFTLHGAARSSTTHGIGTKMDSSGDTSMCCVKLIDAKKYEPKGAISMPIVSHLFDNGKHRGRSMCRCQPASREAKSADFCQAGPPPGAVPRPSDDVAVTSLRCFRHVGVQMLSKCVIFVLFSHNGAEDRPPRGAVPRPGKSKKAVWGSSEGSAPSGDGVRKQCIGRPLSTQPS